MDLVARVVGVLEIDRIDLEEGKIALSFLGRADLALDRIAGAKREPPDLGGRDIDVVRAGEVIGLRRTQETETVLKDFEHPRARDFDFLVGQLLEDREQHILLAHGRGILDLEFFGKAEQICRRLGLEIAELHFLNGHTAWDLLRTVLGGLFAFDSRPSGGYGASGVSRKTGGREENELSAGGRPWSVGPDHVL